MNCPDRDQLEAFVASRLAARRFGIVEKHLEECSRCRNHVEALRVEAELIGSAFENREEDEVLLRRILARLREVQDDES